MRAESALGEPGHEISCVLEQVADKSAENRPAQGHDPAGKSCNHQGQHQLRRSDPGADGRAEFHVSHSHPSQQAESTEEKAAERQAGQTLSKTMPPTKPGGHYNAGGHEWKYQPIRDAAAAQI